MSENTFLVTYVKQHATGKFGPDGRPSFTYTDHYEVFEHLPDAHKRYDWICMKEDDTWSANISRVIRSTDYNLPVHETAVEYRPALQKKWKERGIKSPNQPNYGHCDGCEAKVPIENESDCSVCGQPTKELPES